MSNHKCDGCPNYRKNPYSRRFECYGNCCEVETRADERRKFAEWLINRIHRNSLQRVLSETQNFDIMGIDTILSIYEKEQEEGAENG